MENNKDVTQDEPAKALKEVEITTHESGQNSPDENIHRTPIINPIQNLIDERFTVEGTGGAFGAATIYIDIISPEGVRPTAAGIDPNGTWLGLTSFPAGESPMSFRARQVLTSGGSFPSEVITVYRARLTGPPAGPLIPQNIVFKGEAAPGTTIRIVNADNPSIALSANVTVTPQGTWEAPLTATLPAGPFTAKAYLRLAGFTDGYTNPRAYTLGLEKPVITSPEPGSTQSQNFEIKGNKGASGATVHIYKDLAGDEYGSGLVGGDGTWTVTVRVPSGTVSVVAEQVLGNYRSGRGALRTYTIRPSN
ncbi:hypothetical protein [Pseudomonas sp. S2_A02]